MAVKTRAPEVVEKGTVIKRSKLNMVEQTRKELGLSQEIFARLIGVSSRSISGWERGAAINEVSARRVKEMNRLAIELKKVMRPEFIRDWLVNPIEDLGGISPLETVERGENDRLWRTVFHLGSGIPI